MLFLLSTLFSGLLCFCVISIWMHFNRRIVLSSPLTLKLTTLPWIFYLVLQLSWISLMNFNHYKHYFSDWDANGSLVKYSSRIFNGCVCHWIVDNLFHEFEYINDNQRTNHFVFIMTMNKYYKPSEIGSIISLFMNVWMCLEQWFQIINHQRL